MVLWYPQVSRISSLVGFDVNIDGMRQIVGMFLPHPHTIHDIQNATQRAVAGNFLPDTAKGIIVFSQESSNARVYTQPFRSAALQIAFVLLPKYVLSSGSMAGNT